MEENEELFGADSVGALFGLVDAISGEFGSEYFDFSIKRKVNYRVKEEAR